MKLLLVLLILVALNEPSKAQYCTDFGSSDMGPTPVPSIPAIFQTRVEVNMVEEKKMMEMRYFYDFDKRKAAIELKENNQVNKLIFNYDSNEIFQVKYQVSPLLDPVLAPPDDRPEYPSTCETFKLDEATSLNYYFGFQTNNQNVLPGSVYQVFQFFPQKYLGTDTARGIPSDVYISCQYNPVTKSNFTVKHYFSQTGFSMAGGNRLINRLPIRAEYQGVITLPNGDSKPYTTIHDYHDFRQKIERENVFQTPSGLFCKSRKVTKPIPKIKSYFSFSQEIASIGYIQYIKDFNMLDNFTRYEIRNIRKEEATFFSLDPIVYIADMSIGVQYAINQARGNCSITGVSSLILNQKLNQSFNSMIDFISKLQASNNFLQLDADYIFNGVREANGIKSDRFIANISSNIYEYTFSDENFLVLNEYEPENRVPITLYIDSNRNELNSHSSFYNYNSQIPLLRVFDIGQCFSNDETIQFDIVFPFDKNIVTPTDIANTQKLDFYILVMLYELTGQSNLRFSYPKLSITNNGNLLARITIYPNPPPLKLFTLTDKKLLLVPSINTYRNISSADDCARICLSNIKCLSFDFSQESKVCHLNNRTITDGTLSTSTQFSHYTKNVLEGRKFLDNLELYNLINDYVMDQKIIIDIAVQNSSGQFIPVILTASELRSVRNNINRFGTTQLLSNYRLTKPKTKFANNQQVTFAGLSIDDCARNCNEQVGFECKSFDFCYLTGECQIRRYLESDNQTDLIQDENCDIYERDPLIHYKKYISKVSINPKDIRYENINDPSKCASICDNEKKINCRSFNLCPDKNVCYLSSSHLTDASFQLDDNSICDHYDRNYLQDFTYINTQTVKLSAEVVLSGGSLEQCSTECVSANGFNCKTFDYCPSSKTCLLNSGQTQIVMTQNAETDDCAHYRREYFYQTSQFFNFKLKSDTSQSVLLGLSITFSILSVLIGTLSTIILFRKKLMA